MGAKVTIETHLLNDKRVGRIANLKTLTNDETIQEAIDMGYVVGKPQLISANVKGVLKCMVDAVSKDGNGRKIDSYFSIQPSVQGKLDDVTDDIDKSKLTVKALARNLKEMTVDTDGWNFTVEGSTGSLVINSISTGEKTGEVVLGEDVNINGIALDNGAVSIKWKVAELSAEGTVTAAEIKSRDYSRITIDEAALEALESLEANGKTIVFDITCGNNRAVKSQLCDSSTSRPFLLKLPSRKPRRECTSLPTSSS